MSMVIKFWNVGCGDAITINFRDSSSIERNFFIDSGYVGTYKPTIKQEILKIQAAGQHVDLWIITHTDKDHIGGIEAFIKDNTLTKKEDIVLQYWFNYSTYITAIPSENVSVSQGINFRDFLSETGRLHNNSIIASNIPIFIHDAKFILLSPSQTSLVNSMARWQEVESARLIATTLSDYGNTIEDLIKQPFEEDTEVWNGGSIAFVLELKEKRVLFLADSFPSVIISSLRSMGYSPSNRLKVNYVKLSHHGSKRNFNQDIFEFIDCSNFIILANGITHGLPNKWTLAKILTNPFRTSEKISFHFVHNNEVLRSIFDTDRNKEKYNFDCHYNTAPYLSIELE